MGIDDIIKPRQSLLEVEAQGLPKNPLHPVSAYRGAHFLCDCQAKAAVRKLIDQKKDREMDASGSMTLLVHPLEIAPASESLVFLKSKL